MRERITLVSHIAFGNYTNEWSLASGLELLGISLSIIGNENGLSPCGHPADLSAGSIMYFTDDATLESHRSALDVTFEPRLDCDKLPTDKLWFSRHLESIGECPIPFCTIWEKPYRFPVVVKPSKRSSSAYSVIGRGKVCATQTDLCRLAVEYGGKLADVIVQTFLPGGCCHNYSVCGYFDASDPTRTAIVVTQKLIADNDDLGTGAAVKTVPARADLTDRTARILSSLDYKGPFELEFFQDAESGVWYVLELNSRFWMQHHIFVAAYDNVLLRRYLNLPAPSFADERGVLPYHDVLWIDGVYLVRVMIKCRILRAMRLLALVFKSRRSRILLCPGLFVSTKFVMSSYTRALASKIRKFLGRFGFRLEGPRKPCDQNPSTVP